jgi:hypothetical protein
MDILLLGSGGREDALAWKLRQSPSCGRLIAAPGNPGIARWAECVDADPCDPNAIVELARREAIDLVVVGPEAPLVAGVGDALREAGIAVFGPNAIPAQLEGSKGFTKDLCRANAIPTADYVRVERMSDARESLSGFGIPVVIKADGLAAGKGVTVALSREEAEAAIEAAGDGPLVIEEFLEGEEASLFALVDGETAVALASAQDHKRVGEGDTGPNTGGMGAYAPAPVLTDALQTRAMDEIVRPTAEGQERRFKIGEPPPPTGGFGPPVNTSVVLSDDAKWLAFFTYPTAAEAKKLRKDKKSVQSSVVLVNLATGEKRDFEKVRRFSFAPKQPNWIALHRYGPDGSGPTAGSDLLLVDLRAGAVTSIGNVGEFAFDEAGTRLAWTVDGRDLVGNGVQVRDLKTDVVRVLDSDKAVCRKLTWADSGLALAVLRYRRAEID